MHLMRASRRYVGSMRRRRRTRPFHAFGLGAAKTGTTSLAGMFATHYHSAHEPSVAELITRAPALDARELDDVDGFLRRRDRQLWLDVEVSHPLVHVAHRLPHVFPDARFVVTVRHPADWWPSLASHIAGGKTTDLWTGYRDYRFGGFEYTTHDAPLEAAGVYPLSALLSWWDHHYRVVLDALPPNRTIIVETADLAGRAPEIATFVGATDLDVGHAHLHRREDPRFGAASLDPGYVTASVERICGATVRRLGY